MPAGGVDDSTLRDTLEAAELPDLADKLDEDGHWAIQLSPGEQQRIAFARALVQKPEWLFVDEATSSVDETGKRARTVWCVIGSQERRFSPSATERRYAPFMPGTYRSRRTGSALRP